MVQERSLNAVKKLKTLAESVDPAQNLSQKYAYNNLQQFEHNFKTGKQGNEKRPLEKKITQSKN